MALETVFSFDAVAHLPGSHLPAPRWGDQRLVLGINPWIKPIKFLISITIFVWTLAWFMPETVPDPVRRTLLRWTVGLLWLVVTGALLGRPIMAL